MKDIILIIEQNKNTIDEKDLNSIYLANAISKNISLIVLVNNKIDIDTSIFNGYNIKSLFLVKYDNYNYSLYNIAHEINKILSKLSFNNLILSEQKFSRNLAIYLSSLNKLDIITEIIDFKNNSFLRNSIDGEFYEYFNLIHSKNILLVKDYISKNYTQNNSTIEDIRKFNINNNIMTSIIERTNNIYETPIEYSNCIVSIGRAIKNQEGLNLVQSFADSIGANIAGSRAAVDMGLIDKNKQVGQSGKTINPDIYIAIGISGASHHIIGMRNSKLTIAINTDINCQMVKLADYAYIGDFREALPILIKSIKSEKI